MSPLFKRAGLIFVAFDLFVGVASAGVLHSAGSAAPARGAKMSAAQLELVVGASSGHTDCSADSAGGWDYFCVGADGSRALYDVSADQVTQRSDLPSYR